MGTIARGRRRPDRGRGRLLSCARSGRHGPAGQPVRHSRAAARDRVAHRPRAGWRARGRLCRTCARLAGRRPRNRVLCRPRGAAQASVGARSCGGDQPQQPDRGVGRYRHVEHAGPRAGPARRAAGARRGVCRLRWRPGYSRIAGQRRRAAVGRQVLRPGRAAAGVHDRHRRCGRDDTGSAGALGREPSGALDRSSRAGR